MFTDHPGQIDFLAQCYHAETLRRIETPPARRVREDAGPRSWNWPRPRLALPVYPFRRYARARPPLPSCR